jgi:hypothetical protein
MRKPTIFFLVGILLKRRIDRFCLNSKVPTFVCLFQVTVLFLTGLLEAKVTQIRLMKISSTLSMVTGGGRELRCISL